MAKILLVEDDVEFSEMVQDWLAREHHTVEICADGADGLAMVKAYSYDVLIFDWNLPGMSGVELCQAFRKLGGTTPVIMLTGLGDIDNRTVGLDAGADDYLAKPCDLRELSARVRALLRRPVKYQGEVLKFAHLTLLPSTFEAHVDGEKVELLPKEFALLEFFMRHPGRVFNQDEIIAHVWTSDSSVGPESVRTWIKRLRQKIDKDKNKSVIQSIYGVGYKLAKE